MSEENEISGNWMESTTREEKLNHIHEEAWEEYERVKLEDFLEEKDGLKNISTSEKWADFYLGGMDVYPDSFNDDHLNVIGRSSVAFHQHAVQPRHEKKFVTEVNIHLPATREEKRDEIKNSLNLPEGMGIHFGTGTLGGMPAPEGVITPHIYSTEDITFKKVREAIEETIGVYEKVYNGGEEAIKQQPEEYR